MWTPYIVKGIMYVGIAVVTMVVIGIVFNMMNKEKS